MRASDCGSRRRLITGAAGIPAPRGLHDAPWSVETKGPLSVPAYIVMGSAAQSMTMESTGVSGRAVEPVPDTATQEFPASSVRYRWGMPKLASPTKACMESVGLTAIEV